MAFRIHLFHRVVLLVPLVSLSMAIRVDWNTNSGPIVPPVPTFQPVPRQPFRQPAPVWEDQSNDIPNPNPYQYVLPPPSRPRPATNNYLTTSLFAQRSNGFSQNTNFGQVVSPFAVNGLYYNGLSRNVPSFGVEYVPNVGRKYSAVVPTTGGYYSATNKLNGKFNPKLKKYKAFEKVKLVPQPYFITPLHYQIVSRQQQLPTSYQPQPFQTASTIAPPTPIPAATTTATAETTTTTTTTTTIPSKKGFAYSPNSIFSNSYKNRR